jgi:hypothetical protein
MTDPIITSLVAAMAAGAAAIAQGTASEAAKDAYRSLKTSIQNIVSGSKEAVAALAKYEEDPQGEDSMTILQAKLAEFPVAQDRGIMDALKRLQNLLPVQQTLVNSQQNSGNIAQQLNNCGQIDQQNNFGNVGIVNLSPPKN